MELKYPVFAVAGIVLSVIFICLFLFVQIKGNKTADGIRLANVDLLYKDKYYKRALIQFYGLKAVLVVAVVVSLTASFVLLAKPYYQKKIKKNQYNRDIMICLDISSSVDDLNLKLVKELQDTVRNLSGERIGIVIFNTTPVLLSPMSDDYEYVIEQLENIRSSIRELNKTSFHSGTDWLKWDNYLYGGTLVGNEERGSSLIGDGLMGGLINFPKDSADRTKIMIFATDNQKNGDGYLSLMEAAEYCKKAGVTVYGIGTKYMFSLDEAEMRKAVETTGGKFYLEEDGSAFKDIVDEIESKSASLVEGKTIYKEVETPEKCFIVLAVFSIILIVISILLRRGNIWFYGGSVLLVISLVMTFVFGVLPAHNYSRGPDFQVKRSSNYRVLFVVDDTLSMLANDGPDGTERLTQAKEDVGRIIDELEGAKFSVITFNNDASLLMPFNSNAEHAKNVINAIYPLEYMYATGTGVGTPSELMKQVISEDNGNGKTAVFYIGDGEITNTEAVAKSYADLASCIDSGAVLGYGTSSGGTMRVKNYYNDEYEDVVDYSDYPFEKAVSKIDEKSLKKTADELGVVYINMSEAAGLDSVINKIKGNMNIKEEVAKEEDTDDEFIKAPENYGYFWLIPGIVLLMLNAGYVIKKK